MQIINAIPLDEKTAINYATQVVKEKFEKKIEKIKYIGGGSFGKAFGIDFDDGERIVIKFLRAKNMLDKEVYDLTTVAKHCPVPMPRVLFSRPADGVIPIDCYAMERIEGKTAFFCLDMHVRSKRKRLDFADKVTSALHEIHLCKHDKFGDVSNPQYESWLDYYKPFAKEILDTAQGLCDAGSLSPKVIAAMRAAWDKFDVIFSEKVTDACLIHGDLNINNIMLDSKRNITGFIDPLNSMYADREFDLFQFDNINGKRFYLRKTYIQKYGASKYCDAKCAFYGLFHEVYCFITSGILVNFIMNPLVKNMYRQLKKL